MSACSRLWQVEAARDGRLTGSDRVSAMRHRESCRACAAEARALHTLGKRIAALPEPTSHALATRRARQHLLTTMNESVVNPQPRHWGRLTVAIALSALSLASALAIGRRYEPVRTPPVLTKIIEVHAAPGARWTEHSDALVARVDLSEGAASFKVHPHAGRRVLISVPDGEVEDIGTVFEIRVAEQRTERVSVSEGRVVVRLRGRPELSLGAGQAWQMPLPGPAASALPPAPSVALNPPVLARPRARPIARTSASKVGAPLANTSAAKAEDDAYLRIIDLLHQGKDAPARAQAKRYLLRFPNAFRRVEVLGIATRGVNDTTEGSAEP